MRECVSKSISNEKSIKKLAKQMNEQTNHWEFSMEFDLSTVMAFNLKCKHVSQKWGVKQKKEIVAELYTKSPLKSAIGCISIRKFRNLRLRIPENFTKAEMGAFLLSFCHNSTPMCAHNDAIRYIIVIIMCLFAWIQLPLNFGQFREISYLYCTSVQSKSICER